MNEPMQTFAYDAPPEEDLRSIFQSTAPGPLRDAEEILSASEINSHLAPAPRNRILRWGVSVVAALSLMVMVGLLWDSSPRQLWAQAAEKAQQASSFRCRYTALPLIDGKAVEDANMRMEGTIQWAKSGSFRLTSKNASLDSVTVQPAREPGISIDHSSKSYRKTAVTKRETLPLISFITRMASSRSDAKQDLGESQMEGVKVHGFAVETATVDPDLAGVGDGFRVWVNPESRRIVRMEWNQMNLVNSVDQFVWDEPSDDWFSVKPPQGYVDRTPAPPKLEETTQHIVKALKTFAKYSNGDYPKVKYLYGDVTSARLAKLNGAEKIIQTVFKPGRLIDDEVRRLVEKPEYKEYNEAKEGFARINMLQRENSDAAYHGMKVSSKDKDKVLFRWQLETGDYQVIFGDLNHRTVDKEQLKALEAE